MKTTKKRNTNKNWRVALIAGIGLPSYGYPEEMDWKGSSREDALRRAAEYVEDYSKAVAGRQAGGGEEVAWWRRPTFGEHPQKGGRVQVEVQLVNDKTREVSRETVVYEAPAKGQVVGGDGVTITGESNKELAEKVIAQNNAQTAAQRAEAQRLVESGVDTDTGYKQYFIVIEDASKASANRFGVERVITREQMIIHRKGENGATKSGVEKSNSVQRTAAASEMTKEDATNICALLNKAAGENRVKEVSQLNWSPDDSRGEWSDESQDPEP